MVNGGESPAAVLLARIDELEGTVEILESEIATLRDLLMDVEFSDESRFCPVCGVMISADRAHIVGCELGTALDRKAVPGSGRSYE